MVPGPTTRRGRSFSINPSPITSYKPPTTQPGKRSSSTEPSQTVLPPSPSLPRANQPPTPSPPLLSRSTQGVIQTPSQIPRVPPGSSLPPSLSQVSRPTQTNSLPPAPPSTQTPRPPPHTSVYKRAQSVATTSYAVAEAARRRLIERATKARLYLLHQSGPNRFLIGGDSLASRFHVTIGSQVRYCSLTLALRITVFTF